MSDEINHIHPSWEHSHSLFLPYKATNNVRLSGNALMPLEGWRITPPAWADCGRVIPRLPHVALDSR